MSKPLFSGPVIDRDVFGDALPQHYASDIPYFDVVKNDYGPALRRDRWRLWFEPDRGGWVWDGQRR